MCEHLNASSAMENSTLPTNYAPYHLVGEPFVRSFFLFFDTAIIAAATPSNAFSLYVSWQHIRQKNELGVYLFNLALSDLAFTACLALWVNYLWRGSWLYGDSICIIAIYFTITNFYTSSAFLCCIAVNRYLAVVHPLKFISLRKVGTAAAVSVAIWVLVVCVNIRTIIWEDAYYDQDISECFTATQPESSESLTQINVTRFFLGFVFPILLVVFCTRGICKALKSNQATEEQERKRITKLLIVILLCLLFCLGPLHLMLLLSVLVDVCRNASWLYYLDILATTMASLNCLADPLLYCFITRTAKANVSQVVLFFQEKIRSKDEGMV